MKRMSVLTLFAAMLALAASQVPGSAQAPSHEGHGLSSVSQATFNKDVLPILQKNCQVCHRPGEVAPMSLMTYQDARPWAKAMKTATTSGKMPPWTVEPEFDHNFTNAARLTKAEIATLASWADNGAPEGDPGHTPAAVAFRDGWNLKPDLVVEMPNDFQVQATGA